MSWELWLLLFFVAGHLANFAAVYGGPLLIRSPDPDPDEGVPPVWLLFPWLLFLIMCFWVFCLGILFLKAYLRRD